MSRLELVAALLLGLSLLLRVACGRRVKRGSKYAADAEFHPPIAARWVGPQAVEVGAWAGVVCLFGAIALFIYSFGR
jgi:hypothetical protein